MVLKIEDWEFEVDFQTTENHSRQELEDHCTCGYCRNFYAAVDGKYTNLRPFLQQFGLEIEAPDELFPYEPMLYGAEYAVAGSIVHQGKLPISIDGLILSFEVESSINHAMQGPVFYISIGIMELPWVLNEPMEEVVSPANEPSFLQKMWKKLLSKTGKSDYTS